VLEDDEELDEDDDDELDELDGASWTETEGGFQTLGLERDIKVVEDSSEFWLEKDGIVIEMGPAADEDDEDDEDEDDEDDDEADGAEMCHPWSTGC